MKGKSLVMGMLATLPKENWPVKISSHKIETKLEDQQLSKQKLQKLKGKKNRKNRGKNR